MGLDNYSQYFPVSSSRIERRVDNSRDSRIEVALLLLLRLSYKGYATDPSDLVEAYFIRSASRVSSVNINRRVPDKKRNIVPSKIGALFGPRDLPRRIKRRFDSNLNFRAE